MKKKNIVISLIVTMILGVCFFAGTILASTKLNLSIKPASENVEVGEMVTYDVVISQCEDISGLQFDVVMPAGLTAKDAAFVADKEIIGSSALTNAYILPSGDVRIAIALANIVSHEEPIKIAELTCEAKGSGQQVLELTEMALVNTAYEEVDAENIKYDKEASAIEIEEPVVPCEHVNTEIVNAKDATCEEDGYTGDTYCLDCVQIIAKGQVIEALGHDYDEGVVTTEPGCETEGVLTKTCQREGCGATMTEPIEALGHDYDEGVVTTEPGCETEGVLTKTCQREGCGATTTEAIEALGHDFDEGVMTTEPGCKTKGVMTLTCQRAGCGVTKEVSIDALGHIDENKDKICDRCGEKLPDEPVNPVNPKEEDKPVTPATGINNVTSFIGVLALMMTALIIAGAFILRKKFTK